MSSASSKIVLIYLTTELLFVSVCMLVLVLATFLTEGMLPSPSFLTFGFLLALLLSGFNVYRGVKRERSKTP